MRNEFFSWLAPAMVSMIQYKEALGYSRSSYLPKCKNLDRFCQQNYSQEKYLSKEIVLSWLQRRSDESPASLHNRAGFIRGLAKYLEAIGEEAYVLPERFSGSKTSFVPYIFTDEELAALFLKIDSFKGKDALQPFLLSTVFRLIYTCGLRPNEGRNLKRSDINLESGEILITATKKHKERLVIMSDDMIKLAKSYALLRDAAYPDSQFFFPNIDGLPYSAVWLQNKFKMFFEAANPDTPPDMLPRVRVYDLRHRFASAVLIKWLDEKQDLYARLPYLCTYMGHKELSSTAYYIHLLPENLIKSSGIDWDIMRRMIPEVEIWGE